MPLAAVGFDFLGVIGVTAGDDLRQAEAQIDAAVMELVWELRRRGYQTGLLTNLSRGGVWDQLLFNSGAAGAFDEVILSSDIGLAKPDPRAFAALATRLGVLPDELVFIDDSPRNVAGAEEAGLTAILYSGLPELRLALAGLGLLK